MKLKANVFSMWLEACKGAWSFISFLDQIMRTMSTVKQWSSYTFVVSLVERGLCPVAARFDSRLGIWGNWVTLKMIQKIKVVHGPGAEDVAVAFLYRKDGQPSM